MKRQESLALLTLPNLLTGFRLVAAPILLWQAWNGYRLSFLLLLAACFLSDMLDGLAARLTGQESEFGATLDSWADVTIYLTISVACWWLWPEIMGKEWPYVLMVVASCLLPAIVGFLKFGCFTSYHTWATKFAVAATGITLYLLLLQGMVWPFRFAAVVCMAAAGEEIALTMLLPQPKSNVRSIWRVLTKHNDLGEDGRND